jgi:uncharacterized protein (DUF58 family)
MEVQELLKKVRQIEIKTKGLSRQIFSGAYHSVFKGRGMSFSEVREYVPGDDVRHIDWNVTARAGQTFVKVYEEERELTLMLMIDVSKSTYFGSTEQSKAAWITEIAAVLAFSATQNQDKVGLILFSDQVHLYIPPKKGRQHILRIIREIVVPRDQKTASNLDVPLQYLNGVLHKRCICFLLSDFQLSIPETTLRIVAKKHDVIGIQILDPLEIELKEVGLIHLVDAESGARISVDTSDREWLRSHEQTQREHQLKTKSSFVRSKADFLAIDIRHSYISTLLQFFKRRSK